MLFQRKNLLPLKILVDENISSKIIQYLKDKGFIVISIEKEYRGISDKEVLEVAKKENAIILTEDSDFGEWIFAHKEKCTGVVFLRYKHHELLEIMDSINKILTEHKETFYGKFVVITKNKIRIRDIF